jgi:hypothetical protein
MNKYILLENSKLKENPKEPVNEKDSLAVSVAAL